MLSEKMQEALNTQNFESPMDLFEKTLEHEKFITKLDPMAGVANPLR